MIRSFIAVDIKNPEKLTVVNQELSTCCNANFVKPENLHITLRFLGNIPENMVEKISNIISESCKNISPFKIEFVGLGAFPNINYVRVLWIGIKNLQPLVKINLCIDEELKKIHYYKDKEFLPHITIARVKSVSNKTKLQHILNTYKETKFDEFFVNEVKLKKSELSAMGPKYYDLYVHTLTAF